ncbi:MAG: hypothetical protein AAF726_04855 [Planctomycetota bacterium]
MMRLSLSVSGAALALLASTPAAAFDRIYLVDGSIVEKAEIESEDLLKVVYEVEGERGKKESPTERVLRVEYTKQPDEIAAAAVDAEAGALLGAIAGYQNYLGSLGDGGDRKFGWAPAYARYRLVELHQRQNAIEDMVAAVDDLVANNPDSRYVPLALIQKFETQLLNEDRAGASATATALADLVRSKSLPQRWQYEQRLREILSGDKLSGTAYESALQSISSDAAIFPTVVNRADVATAESLLSRSEFSAAEEMFRSVTESPNADDATLAAAWTGLGDCLYRRAEAKAAGGDAEGAAELFNEAKLAFMRVVVLYRYQLAYVPKSAFYAGRCIQEIGGDLSRDQSNKLFSFVTRNFRSSRWAGSAREFRRRN